MHSSTDTVRTASYCIARSGCLHGAWLGRCLGGGGAWKGGCGMRWSAISCDLQISCKSAAAVAATIINYCSRR